MQLAGCILHKAAPAELVPGGTADLHRGEMHFLPVQGTGLCQELALCEVVLAEFRMMCSSFAYLSPILRAAWHIAGPLCPTLPC